MDNDLELSVCAVPLVLLQVEIDLPWTVFARRAVVVCFVLGHGKMSSQVVSYAFVC